MISSSDLNNIYQTQGVLFDQQTYAALEADVQADFETSAQEGNLGVAIKFNMVQDLSIVRTILDVESKFLNIFCTPELQDTLLATLQTSGYEILYLPESLDIYVVTWKI